MKVGKLSMMMVRWQRCAWCMVLAFVGCSSETISNVEQQTPAVQNTIEMADGTQLEIVTSSSGAVSVTTGDGKVVQFKQGVAPIGNELVIRGPDGRFVAYRQPTVINEQLDKLPYVYLQEGTLEELITDGCLGEPYVHPDDQSFYWTARTCTNPDCDSQLMGTDSGPYVFIHRLSGVKLLEEGRVDFTGVPPLELETPITCPICGQKEHVADYTPGDTVQRRQALADELARVRAARDRAARGS